MTTRHARSSARQMGFASSAIIHPSKSSHRSQRRRAHARAPSARSCAERRATRAACGRAAIVDQRRSEGSNSLRARHDLVPGVRLGHFDLFAGLFSQAVVALQPSQQAGSDPVPSRERPRRMKQDHCRETCPSALHRASRPAPSCYPCSPLAARAVHRHLRGGAPSAVLPHGPVRSA